MKFFSFKVVLYLYKFTIWSCIKYCCHVWADAPSCYLELLDKLQKWISRTIGPLLAASLEPLPHHWNVASLSLLYRYYFGRRSSELAQLIPLPYSWENSLSLFMIFLSPLLDVTRMSMTTVSFFTQLHSGILSI